MLFSMMYFELWTANFSRVYTTREFDLNCSKIVASHLTN